MASIDDQFLRDRIGESRQVIQQAINKTQKPLIVQFSGGKDSMAMVSLVQEITDNFIGCYMQTDIDFPAAISFAKESASNLNFDLLVSTPADHLGGFFERLPKFGWPTIHSLWCNRDLKVRPQRKRLIREFGKGIYYKLVGVRRYESTRRRKMHSTGNFFAEDYHTGGDMLVYPLLNWTTADVKNYLKAAGLPISSLYKKYGVSGCYWCPFYQPSIYRKILGDWPSLYDRFIEWEGKLGASVNGYIYLRDLKSEICLGSGISIGQRTRR